ncbi:hypothetical protein HUJ05_003355 [Dendroctonus ponderosae]|nr:hypothetical protein HUJ05_003355 [Dendroctonus ponderosae]
MNTFFEMPPRRLYTWKAPKDGKDGTIIRNRIDYIRMAKTYSRADIDWDHNLLVAEFRVQWKKLKAKQSTTTYNRRKINKPETEVVAAMTTLKDGMAAGPDEVQSEIAKLFDKDFKRELTIIFNKIYNSRKYPSSPKESGGQKVQ